MNVLANVRDQVHTASLDYAIFKKAMTNACKVVEKGNTIPVLDTVLITASPKGVRVYGTDLDLCTTTFVPGTADPDFVAIVDAHKLKGVMERVKDAATVNFTRQDDKLVVSIGKLNLTLGQNIPRHDFPEDFSVRAKLKGAGVSFTMPAATLAKILDKVQFAISTEETRYYLNGVFMHIDASDGTMSFVTTDGHRLALYEIPLPAGGGAMVAPLIIPRKTVLELLRLLKRKGCPSDVMVTTTDTAMSFLIGEDELLESKAIDGTFPDYNRVIPTRNEHKVPVRTDAFVDAIKQASAISGATGKASKLTLSPGELEITCRDPNFGTASTKLSADHDATFEIGFSATYLLEILALLEGGAMLELSDAGSPFIIKDGGNDEVTYVMMPVRV